tara:strand:+ start:105 stop:257 length:153 start_codon:yes stop_codon:yes gene_type:complete
MQNEMISDFSVEEAKRFFIDVNDHTFSVVFYGSEHPLNTSEKTFLGTQLV